MFHTPITARLTALRTTLLELDFIPESEHLRELRHILLKRLTELERLSRPTDAAAPSQRTTVGRLGD